MKVTKKTVCSHILLSLLTIFPVSVAGKCVAPENGAPPAGMFRFKCYDCNSVFHENCEGDNVTALEEYKIDCNLLCNRPRQLLNKENYTQNQAIGCRKIIQYAGKTERIIRQCAYFGENVQGYRRTGSKNILRYFYQCEEENCNGQSRFTLAKITLIASILFVPFVAHFSQR